jgi:hypothetical protein
VTLNILNKELVGGCGLLDTVLTLLLGRDSWEWAIPRGGLELMVKKTSLDYGIRLRPDDRLFRSLITIIYLVQQPIPGLGCLIFEVLESHTDTDTHSVGLL